MTKYFSRTEESFDLHRTADEAKAAALEAIQLIREECDDEWSDEIHSVCWGVVSEETRQVRCGDNGEYIDYVLEAVK